MVFMASSIARGRVRTTTMESRNMAAILQIIGWQRDMQPWFTVYFFGIWHPCYDQLTPVKTRYRKPKLTAHRGQVFFEADRWPGADFSIGLRAHVWLTCWKQGRIVWKPVNVHQELNVNWIITFSSMQMFLLLCCGYGDYWNSKQKAKQYAENLSAKLQNSNQNCTLSWVSLIGLSTTRSRSYTFRLA